MPFFLLFLLLFTMTGIGNGSTFLTISVCSPRSRRVLRWAGLLRWRLTARSSSQVFGEQIKAATPGKMRQASFFYAVCLVLNWWYYLGPKAEFKNP